MVLLKLLTMLSTVNNLRKKLYGVRGESPGVLLKRNGKKRVKSR
jgi:hypothetical protein